MRFGGIVSTAAAFGAVVLANDGISSDTLSHDAAGAAAQAAPLWFLPTGTCMPSSAVWDGQQTNGNDPDHCNLAKLDNNCPAQNSWQGAYTKSHDFPTYYMVRYCSGLDQWRILYDVYFTKDTGHKSDWEWAVMVLKNGNDGKYYRDSVIMENEGDHGYSTWASIPEAYTSNLYNNDGSNGNHAKLYISKWHHSVHTTDHTNTFKNTCPPSGNDDFRANDYYYVASDWLSPYTDLTDGWDWGAADSFPHNFLDGRKYDICTKM